MRAERSAGRILPAGWIAAAAVLAYAAPPQTTVAKATPRLSRDVQVNDAAVWTATDIEVKPNERVVFAASGTASCTGEPAAIGPDGLSREFRDLLRILPLAQAGRAALIGRVGAEDVAQAFLIGTSLDMVAPTGGALSIGINERSNERCHAEFKVHVDVYEASGTASTPGAREVATVPGVDQRLFAQVPRRVGDNQGNAGDMVNFVILGSEAVMQHVFMAAGWVRVDPDVKGALVAGLLDSLSKAPYLTLPMSQLYLFGRPQDYGWAHAEPIKVVASRHHLRVWKASFTAAESVVWVGAATHDIGFDRDQRNNRLTHKIDPDVDLERDYVMKTLTSTGLVSAFAFILPDNPLREAKTATGGSFHSDGRVLILRLLES